MKGSFRNSSDVLISGFGFWILNLVMIFFNISMARRPWENADSTVGKESPSQRGTTAHLVVMVMMMRRKMMMMIIMMMT